MESGGAGTPLPVPLPVPPDLEAALAAAPAARATFDRLPPETKDAWIQWIGRARSQRARLKRIAYLAERLTPTAQTVEEDVPPPLPPRQEWWPWLLALALALLIAALLVWLLVYRDNGDTHNTVVVQKGTVPNVIGQPRATAEQTVKQASLRPVVTKQVSDQAPDTVVAERPAPGTVLKGGAPVTLVISRGPAPVAVPNVKGLAAADAVAKLQQAKLAPRLVEVRSKETAGTVISQNPSAGAKAKPGTRVTLNVSKGVGKVTVPAVSGEPVAAATSELQAAGFKVQTTNVDSNAPKGLVVTQTPRGGEAAKKGSTVKLTVSKGAAPTTTAATTTTAPTTTQQQTTTQRTTTTAPATTTQPSGTAVPALTGKGLATALQQLEAAGLRATVKYQSSQAPLGRVIGQNPASGTRVPPRTRIQVNVSEGPNPGNPTPVPDEVGQDEATARSDLEGAGFQVIVIQRTGGGQAGTVVEQQPTAGTSIASDDFVVIYVAR